MPRAPDAAFAVKAKSVWVGFLRLALSKRVDEDATVGQLAVNAIIGVNVIDERVCEIPRPLLWSAIRHRESRDDIHMVLPSVLNPRPFESYQSHENSG